MTYAEMTDDEERAFMADCEKKSRQADADRALDGPPTSDNDIDYVTCPECDERIFCPEPRWVWCPKCGYGFIVVWRESLQRRAAL